MNPYLPADGLAFLRIDQHGDAWVAVLAVPNASSTHLAGVHGEPGSKALRARLKAIPEGGKANDALIKRLAGYLDVPPKAIMLVRGENLQAKTVACRCGGRKRCQMGQTDNSGRPIKNQALLN